MDDSVHALHRLLPCCDCAAAAHHACQRIRPAAAATFAHVASPLALPGRSVPWQTDDATLLQHFSQFGVVEEAQIMREKYTGKSRGFGFVTFRATGARPLMECAVAAIGPRKKHSACHGLLALVAASLPACLSSCWPAPSTPGRSRRAQSGQLGAQHRWAQVRGQVCAAGGQGEGAWAAAPGSACTHRAASWPALAVSGRVSWKRCWLRHALLATPALHGTPCVARRAVK